MAKVMIAIEDCINDFNEKKARIVIEYCPEVQEDEVPTIAQTWGINITNYIKVMSDRYVFETINNKIH